LSVSNGTICYVQLFIQSSLILDYFDYFRFFRRFIITEHMKEKKENLISGVGVRSETFHFHIFKIDFS